MWMILTQIVSILLVLYVFEMTKSVVSTVLGDPTPKNSRMLTLNIFRYFEPIGFMLTLFFGYGWGQPAQVSPRHYKNKKAGILAVYITPMVLAIVLAAGLNILGKIANEKAAMAILNGAPEAVVYAAAIPSVMAIYFVKIAVFNLIPIPPMCGYEIVRAFLPPNEAFKFGQNAPIYQMFFLFLWFFGIITPLLDKVCAAFLGMLF